MPTQTIIVPEWRDEQTGSKYPFSDNSSLLGTGGIEIEKDLFLDAIVYAIGAEAPLYITSIAAESRLVTVTIQNTAATIAITGSVDPFGGSDSIPLIDSYGRPAGILVCDAERIARLTSWPLGTFYFENTAELVASVVVPLPESYVSGFSLPDGSIVTGEVWFVGETGVVVRKDTDETMRFDIVGDPLFKRTICQAPGEPTNLFVTPNFVQTINGIGPDTHGNFFIAVNNELAGDSILRVYPDLISNVVKIEFVGQRLETIV